MTSPAPYLLGSRVCRSGEQKSDFIFFFGITFEILFKYFYKDFGRSVEALLVINVPEGATDWS